MVELIAWNSAAQVFDFWELTGTGTDSEWHFQGNTHDILEDIKDIRMGGPNPAFGKRLRCSGCHTQGGPIMKELAAPRNDWWTTAKKLNLGTMTLKQDRRLAEDRVAAADRGGQG